MSFWTVNRLTGSYHSISAILPGLQFKVEPVATSSSACGCRPKILMRRQIGGHWPTYQY